MKPNFVSSEVAIKMLKDFAEENQMKMLKELEQNKKGVDKDESIKRSLSSESSK